MENANVSVCLNELLSLEHGEVQSRVRLHAAKALLSAAENSLDAIEITNEDYLIQVRIPSMVLQ